MPALGGRFHWPDQSGYFDVSCASAGAAATASASRDAASRWCLSIVIILFFERRLASLLSVLEIFQVGRRLALAHRHQEAIGADIIVVLADLDVAVVFRAIVFEPHHVLLLAHVFLGDGPGPRQRLVECGDLIDP